MKLDRLEYDLRKTVLAIDKHSCCDYTLHRVRVIDYLILALEEDAMFSWKLKHRKLATKHFRGSIEATAETRSSDFRGVVEAQGL